MSYLKNLSERKNDHLTRLYFTLLTDEKTPSELMDVGVLTHPDEKKQKEYVDVVKRRDKLLKGFARIKDNYDRLGNYLKYRSGGRGEHPTIKRYKEKKKELQRVEKDLVRCSVSHTYYNNLLKEFSSCQVPFFQKTKTGRYIANTEVIYSLLEEYTRDELKDCIDLIKKRIENIDKAILDTILPKDRKLEFMITFFHLLLSLLSDDGRKIVFSLNPVMFYKEDYNHLSESYSSFWKLLETPRQEGKVRYKNIRNFRQLKAIYDGKTPNIARYPEMTNYKRAYEYYCNILPEETNISLYDQLLLGVLVARFYLDVIGREQYEQYFRDYMKYVMQETRKIAQDLNHLKWYSNEGRPLKPDEKPF